MTRWAGSSSGGRCPDLLDTETAVEEPGDQFSTIRTRAPFEAVEQVRILTVEVCCHRVNLRT
jgi:hypothetical protein